MNGLSDDGVEETNFPYVSDHVDSLVQEDILPEDGSGIIEERLQVSGIIDEETVADIIYEEEITTFNYDDTENFNLTPENCDVQENSSREESVEVNISTVQTKIEYVTPVQVSIPTSSWGNFDSKMMEFKQRRDFLLAAHQNQAYKLQSLRKM